MARMARGTRGTPNKKKVTRLTFLYLFFFEINRILCTFVARYHSRWDRYLGMTAAMTQAPVLEIPTAILCMKSI